jgi:glutamyl-tRNA synthetase
LDELVDTGLYFWQEPDSYEEKALRKHWTEATPSRMRALLVALTEQEDWSASSLEALFKSQAEILECKFAELIHPTRLAVSGLSFGPGLFELLEALGCDAVLRRIARALDTIQEA